MKLTYKHCLIEHTSAEMVFNPTDSNLRNNQGFALALSRAAGPQFQHYADELVHGIGTIPEGTGVATPSFGLNVLGPQWVFQGVLPVVGIRNAPTTDELAGYQRVILSSFYAANARGCQTLAIPWLVGGIYGYSAHDFMNAMAYAFMRFEGTSEDSRGLQEVQLVSLFKMTSFQNSLDRLIKGTTHDHV